MVRLWWACSRGRGSWEIQVSSPEEGEEERGKGSWGEVEAAGRFQESICRE